MVKTYSLENIARKLNISIKDLNKAFKKKIIREDEFKNIRYLLFKKNFKNIEKGTVVILNEQLDIIRGYPKTYRALTLYPTIKEHFIDKVVIEEKLNGYNIRVAKIDDEILALTRSGYVCPFTTKKVKKYLKLEILDEYEHYMLCGEMIGKNNPYVPFYYEEAENDVENLAFFIFDIKERENNRSLPIKDRLKLCENYNLPHVRPIDIVDKDKAHEVIKDIIIELNNKRREGVVLKDPDMSVEPLKYTTHFINCQDLKEAFYFLFDLGLDFMFSRVIREGFMSYEFGECLEDREIRAIDIGKSILFPMVEAIEKVAKGERITEDFELIFDSENDFSEFLDFMRKMKMIIKIKNIERKEDRLKVLIGKVYNKTSDKIKAYLEGALWE
ncbi:ATP dependent DNA ligase [Methanocaldococcus villosus KIN24-T80]|uniref:ATP dependent DNA ligase n=1 Tax=Methanocaldococcus villosus KIN24-T80 TaxID=1069083 RepID=N6V2L6_9EURY|nr:RNA ligase [Methanocaldococcus villosus]ENN96503.1 ATP dependent DNA ligase [Methanocaldococcus villosus KIN24-T80]